jgi:pimeloyl-ACP methyl ester carboxylesterase
MFPAPRQLALDAMTHATSAITMIAAPTLIVHGREDQVIPLQNAHDLLQAIPDAQLHVFGRCGHWTQLEHADAFNELVTRFLRDADVNAHLT